LDELGPSFERATGHQLIIKYAGLSPPYRDGVGKFASIPSDP
jgi:hypothetical protein